MSNPVLLLVVAMFPALVAVKQGRIAICPCEKNGSPLGAPRLSGPLFGGTCLSGPPHNAGLPIALQRARRACPSQGPAPPRPSPHAGRESIFPRVRGDARGAAFRQPSEKLACCVPLAEGPAGRVRCATLDYPFQFLGHDRRAPPNFPFGAPLSSGV